jgi:hypothetical protein
MPGKLWLIFPDKTYYISPVIICWAIILPSSGRNFGSPSSFQCGMDIKGAIIDLCVAELCEFLNNSVKKLVFVFPECFLFV